MNTLITVVVAAVVLLGALLVYASTKSDNFRIERSIVVDAPPEKVFPLINDFHRWASWSPFETKDPALKRTFSGPEAGVGSIYQWEGNNQVGKGRMEIQEASAPERVQIQLDFLAPFEAHNTAEFTMQPQGNTTRLSWAMYGPNSFIGKVMSIFFSMDQMVGKDFETGLSNLKALAEK